MTSLISISPNPATIKANLLPFSKFTSNHHLPLPISVSCRLIGIRCSRVFRSTRGRRRRRSWSAVSFSCAEKRHGLAAAVNRDDGTTVGDSSEEEEIMEGEDEVEDGIPERWDVIGIGQAMVDFSGTVDDEFLQRLGLQKGTRKIVNHEERGKVLRAMDGCSYKAAAGGSLSNTLVALARLGCETISSPALNVGMVGSVGSDPLGGFYRSKLTRANVKFLSESMRDATTGTVIVLTTPDAQRTMLAYQGTSSTVTYDASLASILSKTAILVIEGYMFEFPEATKTILRACEVARAKGTLVAVTASDISCIEKFYDRFWEVIVKYADILFANSDEARGLGHFASDETPISVTRYLSRITPLVCVTDGAKGSYIAVKGEVVYIPPEPCLPVDTCGAGDAYAAGILYGILRGSLDLKGVGDLASKVAAVVVGQQGTRLRIQDATRLATSLPDRKRGSGVCLDILFDSFRTFNSI